MDREEIRRRIAEIRTELVDIRNALTGRTAELDDLIAQLGDDDGGGGRPIFTLIKGGLSGLIMPASALTRRPRHPIAAAGTAAVAGAIAAVLLVPTHTTNGGRGTVMSYISIPAEPLPSATTHQAPHGWLPAAHVGRPGPSAPARIPRGLPTPPVTAARTVMPTAPAATPTPSATLPSATASASASASGSESAPVRRCVIEVQVTGVIRVCLG